MDISSFSILVPITHAMRSIEACCDIATGSPYTDL
jgi:hypothetical protein